jgi:hypothetical protein
MIAPSSVFGMSRRTPPARDNRVPGGSGHGPVEHALEVLHIAESFGVNILLLGTSDVVGQVMTAIGSNLREPIVQWSPGEPFVLPAADGVATLVLNDVGLLPLQDQIKLLEWLSAAQGSTQVISTTETLLLPRIQAGAFIDTLYYRLNTVCIDATT